MLDQSHVLDRTFHALSDATRRALLDRLAKGSASVSELAGPFDTSLAAIVQHVQVLEASGLITTEKVGRTRTCRLATEAVLRAERWLTERRQLWEARFDRLGTLLEAEDAETKNAKAFKRKRNSKS
jgi:DNA-binding transcriptional ArsR family regulator